MNIFDKPIVLNSIDLFEGVYAESGDLPDGPTAQLEIHWEGHNSGSHSEVQVFVTTGSEPGEHISVQLSFNGKGEISSMGSVTNCSYASNSSNSVTIERDGHYNPNERIGIMITDIRFTESQYEGGVGSYWPSETHMHEVAPEWSGSAICS